MSVAEILKYGAVGTGVGLLICLLCYNSLYSLPVAAVTAGLYLRMKKKELNEARRRRILYHFKDLIASLHNSMRSGYSVENGIAAAAAELEALYGSRDELTAEIRNIVSRMRLQVPVEELFLDLARRSGVEDIEMFAELLAIAKRTGGNLGKLLDDTWRTICDKIDTRQEIEKHLASVRFEQKIMSLMPALIILYLRFSFSGFMEKLYGNPVGIAVMTVCLLLYAVAFFWGRKLVEIEV